MNLILRLHLYVALFLLLFTKLSSQNCKYSTLVKCFTTILDEWMWTLFELKDNVVTINQEQCEYLRQLDKCIQDDGLEPHECNHNEIVAASNTVSDLLTHRKNSGSFLRSYYLLTYACSPEGQELLNEHRACLSRERIGEMTLSAGTYLSEKFLEHPDDEVCTEVNNKLQEYMNAMAGLCEEEASQIMCKSLTNMFKGLHADKLHNCEFSCLRTQPSNVMHHVKNINDISEPHHDLDENNHADDDQAIMQGQTASVNGNHLNGSNRMNIINLFTAIFLFVGAAIYLAR